MCHDGQLLIVAGRSARLMAEAARRDGFHVIALDAFGDVDTRRAAHRWAPIGAAPAGRLDVQRTLAALRGFAESADAGAAGPIGWVAGSDFECEPDLLTDAAALLPLLGTAPADVRRVREPAEFFAALQRLRLPHPATRFDAPADGTGWLRKLGRGCGGWHIRHATGAPPVAAEHRPYFQREAAGQPMSALFVAHAAGLHGAPGAHRLIGCNALIVRPLGAHPHVYRGAIGPIDLPPDAARALAAAIDALVGAFTLRGLCSLDLLWHAERWSLLEINPRPSASMALYAHLPLMRLHVAACRGASLDGAERGDHAALTCLSDRIDRSDRSELSELSDRIEPSDLGHRATPPAACRGIETVFARDIFRLDADAAAALAARGDCHDLPQPGSVFAPGDPVCSVGAVGNNAQRVREVLAAKRQTLRAAWSTR